MHFQVHFEQFLASLIHNIGPEGLKYHGWSKELITRKIRQLNSVMAWRARRKRRRQPAIHAFCPLPLQVTRKDNQLKNLVGVHDLFSLSKNNILITSRDLSEKSRRPISQDGEEILYHSW